MSEQQNSTSKTPVVLMFQPTRFEVVTGEKLQEWQQMLHDKVGLKGKLSPESGGLPSICFCDYADDCDQI